MKRVLTVTAVFMVGWSIAGAQRTIPLSLKTMVRQAGTIVHATVSETRTGKDPVTGMPATWVTLDVSEDFYGAPAKSFTFKQIGGEMNGMAYRPADVPRFSAREDLILLLYPEHPVTGFRSPVGLGQGKFIVRTPQAPRKKVAEQVTPTLRLLRSTAEPGRPQELTFDRLAEEIRALVRTEKGGAQ